MIVMVYFNKLKLLSFCWLLFTLKGEMGFYFLELVDKIQPAGILLAVAHIKYNHEISHPKRFCTPLILVFILSKPNPAAKT